MAGVAILDTRSPIKNTSLNTILGWFSEDKKTNVSIQTLFHQQGWFHRCVDLRAKSIQSMPWSITATGSDTVVWDSDAPELPEQLKVLDNLPGLLYLWEASLVTVGSAYTIKENEGRGISNLFYLSPTKVEPIKTPSRGVVGYKRNVNSGQETYDVEDMIAIHSLDPFIENGPGVSGATAGKKNVQVLRALDGFLANFLDKGAIKATILTVDGGENIHPDQVQNLRTKWNKMLGGWFNGGENEVFNSKVKPEVIGEGLSDLSDSDLTSEQREAVCAALGIPFSLVMSNAANFATAELDHVNYYMFTVVPQAKFLQRQLNRQLFSEMGYRFTFHPEQLEVMQRYELDKAQKVVQITGGPVLTMDEGRELLGYEPLGSREIVVDAREEDTQPRQLAAATEESADESAADVKGLLQSIQEQLEALKVQPVAVEAKWQSDTGKEQDITAWRRKISRNDRGVKFSPDHLSEYEAAIIRQRIDDGEELDAVFAPPFVGF